LFQAIVFRTPHAVPSIAVQNVSTGKLQIRKTLGSEVEARLAN
jgi:hypothetical protein